jgi:hypothetical protein
MFEQGVVCKINGRDGAKVHLYGKLRFDKKIKVINSVDVADLTPIPLTPKILTEWCGFKHVEGTLYILNNFALSLEEKGFVFIQGIDVNYLHELQNLYYVLNKQELEIKG